MIQYGYKNLLILIFAVAFSVSVKAQQTKTDTSNTKMSLKQAIDYALQHQVNVLNAEADAEIAADKVKETIGIGLPQINGSFDVKDFVDIPTVLIPAEFFGGPPGVFQGVKFGTKYNATAGLTASQILFNSSYIVGLQAAKVYRDLSKKVVKRTQIETAEAVTKAYYSVLVNEERMKLVNQNVTRVKKLLDDTKVMHQNGFVEQIDLDRITVTYNNMLVQQENTQRLMRLGYALLKYQMGMTQKDTLILADSLQSINMQPKNISAQQFKYANRIEYGLMQTQLEAAQLELKKNRFDYLPSLALYGSFSQQAQTDKLDFFKSNEKWYPTGIVGVTLNVPIFDGLQKNYRIQQAKLNVIKAKNNITSLEQGIDLQLSQAQTSLQNAISTLNTQKKNIDLAEHVDEVSKQKYEQGVGSNTDVINAETALKEAQTNYYNALYDALVAKVEYEKANGTLIK